jgi:Fe-S-cluster containining protein
MRDGPLRRALKRLALWNFQLNLLLSRRLRLLRGQRPFVLAGDCRRCARCCEAPAIQVSRPVFYLATLRQAFLLWQSRVNGFELVEARARRTFVFRCRHFDWATRSCDSYDSRPGICRDYPRALLEQPSPEFFSSCGYRAIAPNADALLGILERTPLTPEQRARLKKGLYLEK